MSENELTKDAEYMLCALYKSYLNRRKNGVNKHDAKSLVHQKIFIKIL